MEADGHGDGQIRAILSGRRLAVIGMSSDPAKDAHRVPAYLASRGYSVLPVNPNADTILGRRALPDVSGAGPADTVVVFRPSEKVPELVPSILSARPKTVWLQLGIRDPASEKAMRSAGIDVVFGRCMMSEHARLAA